MLRMARAWTGALIAGTLTLVTSLMFSPLRTASAEEPAPPPPAAPGAKPSKERFSNAMQRLREQRRAGPERAKAKRSPTTASHQVASKSASKPKRVKRKRDRDAKRRDSKRDNKKDERPRRGGGHRVDLLVPAEKTPSKSASEANKEPVPTRKVRRPAPALPEPQFTELEKALKQALRLKIVDLGPDERWRVTLANLGQSPVEIAADPRLLSFEAHVPGKAQPVRCRLPEALLPRANHVRRRALAPGEQYSFSIDPLMYCFETGDQTILVPGTFLTPTYGFPEKTKTRWSWGRKYEERLEQEAPFLASYPTHDQLTPAGPPPVGDSQSEQDEHADVAPAPSASASGLKQLLGEGFALRSEYQGWAKARTNKHALGDRPRKELKLSISGGSDAPSARDVSVTVKIENQSELPQRVYFRRDLVSFLVQGPDGEHQCSPSSAELRAPDKQAFTTIAPGKSASFTTQLLEFCPAASFARAGFYYVSAVLPATSPGVYPDEDVFTGKLAASKPRAVRLHKAELPFLLRRGPNGGHGGGAGAVSNTGRFSRPPGSNMVPEGEMIAPLPAPPPEAPAPVEAPPPPPPPQ